MHLCMHACLFVILRFSYVLFRANCGMLEAQVLATHIDTNAINFANSHTLPNAQDLFQLPKLSSTGPRQY